MKSVVKSAYDDALSEMRKVIPENVQQSFVKNKKKFLILLLIPVIVEVLIVSGAYELMFG